MLITIRLAAATLLTVALVVACTGSPGGTAAPTLPQVTLPPLPSLSIPSFPPATELESLFPDQVGGNSITIRSARGEDVVSQFAASDPDRFRTFITDLGASVDQISAALSFNLWPGATAGEFTGVTITALRVEGVPASTTLAGFTAWVEDDIDGAQVSQQTIGGKSVTAIVDPEDAESSAFLYAAGDVVFMVGGTPALVEEAFSKLP